ncbi:aldose 1-epimerase [Conexibacter sp. DBS9H8]|uniref:aldose 1-epimerase n=1 Tax=Conexibacter sp. DBS9H8 TaxID=2937801 RepID=UPI00200CC5F4|nr:aldose 1-epimerase [Conexibacter sp. DBS9H8]
MPSDPHPAVGPEDPTAVTLVDADTGLTARFLPGNGMVCQSLRHRGEELLAQRGGPEAYRTRGSTFALPILYPWANRLFGWSYRVGTTEVTLDPADRFIHRDGDAQIPMHGVLAGAVDWRLQEVSDAALTAELDYGADPRRIAVFPFPHRLGYRAQLSGSALGITVTVTPIAAAAVPVSFGFHPYLNPGGDRQDWQLAGPVPGLDGALGQRTFDAEHRGVGGAVLSVASKHRRIELALGEGYPVAHLYAPEGSPFVCFEPMVAPTNALRTGEGLITVAPGDVFTATFTLRVVGL